jgi:hypothetical protein
MHIVHWRIIKEYIRGGVGWLQTFHLDHFHGLLPPCHTETVFSRLRIVNNGGHATSHAISERIQIVIEQKQFKYVLTLLLSRRYSL